MHANLFRGICKVEKLTSKEYAKTFNFLCASNKDFVKYQAKGGANPKTPVAYALGPRSLRFYSVGKGCDFGSRWPDVMVIVRWLTHAEPTLCVEGSKRQVAINSWNSLSACFYGLVSSVQKKLFTPIIFLWVIHLSHIWHLRYIGLLRVFIKNRMILENKATLLVLKLLSESYIFYVFFVINFSWRKVYFFIFENRVLKTRR